MALENPLLSTASPNGQPRGLDLQCAAWACLALSVDDKLLYVVVGDGGISDARPADVRSQLRRRDVSASGRKFGTHGVRIGCRVHDELDAQLMREAARELKFKAFCALRLLIKRRGAIERDDAQLAMGSNPLDLWRLWRAAANERNCNQRHSP